MHAGYIIAALPCRSVRGIGDTPQAAWDDFRQRMASAGVRITDTLLACAEDEISLDQHAALPAESELLRAAMRNMDGTKMHWSLRWRVACLPSA